MNQKQSKTNTKLENNIFITNTANELAGATYIIGDAILINNYFSKNNGKYAGALRIDQSENSQLENNIFEENTATNAGGAAQITGDVTLTNNQFIANSATHGGALRIESKTNTQLKNNLFTGNTANNGGAAYITGDTTLTNNQFITNKASIGGALRIESKTKAIYLKITLQPKEEQDILSTLQQ